MLMWFMEMDCAFKLKEVKSLKNIYIHTVKKGKISIRCAFSFLFFFHLY